MAIQMNLLKEFNHMYTDFLNAYWVIENINIAYIDKTSKINIQFCCYPSREAYKSIGTEIQHLRFGGSIRQNYNTKLYEFYGIFLASEIFPDGIPNTREAQLNVLYPFIKNYLNLTESKDVFE